MNLTTRKSEEESKCVWQSSRGLIKDLWKLLETTAEKNAEKRFKTMASWKKNYLKKGGLKKEKISKRCLRGWNTQPRVEPHINRRR